jgi:hypothetical protein
MNLQTIVDEAQDGGHGHGCITHRSRAMRNTREHRVGMEGVSEGEAHGRTGRADETEAEGRVRRQNGGDGGQDRDRDAEGRVSQQARGGRNLGAWRDAWSNSRPVE